MTGVNLPIVQASLVGPPEEEVRMLRLSTFLGSSVRVVSARAAALVTVSLGSSFVDLPDDVGTRLAALDEVDPWTARQVRWFLSEWERDPRQFDLRRILDHLTPLREAYRRDSEANQEVSKSTLHLFGIVFEPWSTTDSGETIYNWPAWSRFG